MWCCTKRSFRSKAGEAGVDDGEVHDCQGAFGLSHLFWLQTVGSSWPSQTSHHLLLFLNLSVLQSVKWGNFLFGFQQRKDLIAALSPFLPSQMFPVWISIPFQLFFFKSPVLSSFFCTQNQHIRDFNRHDPPLKKPNIWLPLPLSQVECFPSSDCLPFSTRVHSISAEQDVFPRNCPSTSCSLLSVHAEMTQHSRRNPIKQCRGKMRVNAEEEINSNQRIVLHKDNRNNLLAKTRIHFFYWIKKPGKVFAKRCFLLNGDENCFCQTSLSSRLNWEH